MRTLKEIMDDVIEGTMPTHEECYYALKAYRLMHNINHHHIINNAAKAGADIFDKKQAELAFEMYNGALKSNPRKWISE